MLPISHTKTITLFLSLISFDLLIKSFEGIFFELVICPESNESESLKSIINASSLFDRLTRV